MIIGIGIDIVSIPDMAERVKKTNFIEKVFTVKEINYCLSYQNSAERFAGKFAAKEAFMKAINMGIKQEIWFLQIEIRNRVSGAPEILCSGKAEETLSNLAAENIHVSISHNKNTAIAMVIVEG